MPAGHPHSRGERYACTRADASAEAHSHALAASNARHGCRDARTEVPGGIAAMRLIAAGLALPSYAESIEMRRKAFSRTSRQTARRDERLLQGRPRMAAAMQQGARDAWPDFSRSRNSPSRDDRLRGQSQASATTVASEYCLDHEFATNSSVTLSSARSPTRRGSVRSVRHRERISVQRSARSPIGCIVESGKMKGNFTTCALLQRDAPANRQACRKQYGLECDLKHDHALIPAITRIANVICRASLAPPPSARRARAPVP